MFWFGGPWTWWQASLMSVGTILFPGLLVWVVYAVITSRTRARHVLDQRLAKGEIDEDQYRRLRNLIA